jgi:hypothetical protein
VTVVLKHLFTPDDAEEGGASFVSDLEADVTAECEKLGTIEKVRWGGGSGGEEIWGATQF